ncbi:MAG: FAD-binding protein [Micromonosporaceae bacterium]|nr:FAD-binding protein [Micromonosporaceae bacterium]
MDGMRWDGWGDPAATVELPATLAQLLEHALGVSPAAARPPVAPEAVRLPEPSLPAAVRDQLAAVVGGGQVSTAAADRVRHTRGKSTTDLLRIRAGEADDAPDAVVRPADHDQVLAVLRVCAARRVAVVPFGGGTSVVGGLAPDRAGFAGTVALDLSGMDSLVAVDPVSQLVTLAAGVTGPAAEHLLAGHGFTLGHYPQSFEYATIGGFAATRSSGLYSSGYGRFDDLVVALRVATPEGTVQLGRAPRSAAGPDLRQLFLGSEGTLGVITEVTVRVRPVPTERACTGWQFDSFPAGMTALRTLAQEGLAPSLLRLSDEYETAGAAATGGIAASGCLAVVGYEGRGALRRRPDVEAVVREAGGSPLDGDIGKPWRQSRFRAPYLRDALLAAGALAETVETAAFWSGLLPLYEAVRGALLDELAGLGTPPMVLCHVSHVYPTGASLYFTVVCAQAADPVGQWRRAKQAASTAIVATGGTITHHHAVGRDHAGQLAAEIGPLGLAAIRAVKQRLDPAGILNPGVLLADPGA